MELTPFADVDLSTLRWTPLDGAPHAFQLLAGDARIATLTWDQPHGSRATAETTQGMLSLKRVGYLHPHLTVRRKFSDKDLARLVTAWRDHRIELSGGAAFDLKRGSILVPAWTVSDATTGIELIHIEPVRTGRRLEGGIYEVDPPGVALAALPILLVLSWYFVVLAWFEDETVAEWADHAEGRF